MASVAEVLRGCVFSAVLILNTAVAFGFAGDADPFEAATQLHDEALKHELQRLVSKAHKTSLDYSEARKVILKELHVDGEMIHEVYCQKDIPAKQWQDDKLINIEHTWPQSRFGGGGSKSIKKSDLHHLFPTDSQMNNSRGNFKFGDVDGPTKELKCSESRMSDGPKGPRFEPPAAHKGNVARALFYFSVRYDMTIDADEEKTIRRWHELDPVDDAERARNEAIEARQGNRNPFIDHPEFAEQISNF